MILSKYRVSLGGITFGETDENGASWVVTELKGWHAVGSTGQTTQRVFRDGGWNNRAYLAARGYTLEGFVYTPNGDAPDLLDQLVSAIPLDSEQAMTVTGVHPQPRMSFVRQEGVPDIAIESSTYGRFSIGLVAADPVRYGVEQHLTTTALPSTTGGLTVPFTVPFSINATTVSGLALVRNAGTARVFPRVVIYGPVSDPIITNTETGEFIRVALDIEAGDWIDLDFAEHTAYLNGVASRRGNVSGQWFSLAPGNNFLSFTSPTYSADAAVQIVWRDGWK